MKQQLFLYQIFKLICIVCLLISAFSLNQYWTGSSYTGQHQSFNTILTNQTVCYSLLCTYLPLQLNPQYNDEFTIGSVTLDEGYALNIEVYDRAQLVAEDVWFIGQFTFTSWQWQVTKMTLSQINSIGILQNYILQSVQFQQPVNLTLQNLPNQPMYVYVRNMCAKIYTEDYFNGQFTYVDGNIPLQATQQKPSYTGQYKSVQLMKQCDIQNTGQWIQVAGSGYGSEYTLIVTTITATSAGITNTQAQSVSQSISKSYTFVGEDDFDTRKVSTDSSQSQSIANQLTQQMISTQTISCQAACPNDGKNYYNMYQWQYFSTYDSSLGSVTHQTCDFVCVKQINNFPKCPIRFCQDQECQICEALQTSEDMIYLD